MCTFTDKKNRVISLTLDESADILTALHDSKEVGKAEICDRDYSQGVGEPDWVNVLAHISIEDNYQKAGIGSEMVRELVNIFGSSLCIPSTGDTNSDFFLSSAGASLMNSCTRNRILPENVKKWR